MSRSAVRFSLIVLAGLLAGPFGASAATAQPIEGCRDPRVVTARFKEQVCYRSESGAGYVACRWIHREHDVLMPGDCTPKYSSERALPASPTTIHGRRAGLAAKG